MNYYIKMDRYQSIRTCWECRTLFRKYDTINKSGYNTYRKWTQTGYPSRHFSTKEKGEETLDAQRNDGRTNFTL